VLALSGVEPPAVWGPIVPYPPYELNVTVTAVKVNVAVPVCVPLVAVTAHVPAAVAVSDVPVTAQSVLVVA
jgi:hypothetical protein